MIIIAAALSLMLTGCGIDLEKIPEMILPAEDISVTSVPAGEEITPELLYDMFTGELRQFRTKVTINRNVEPALITATMDAIQRKAPDIFWIDGYTITTGTKNTEAMDVSLIMTINSLPMAGRMFLTAWGRMTRVMVFRLERPRLRAASICP